MECGVVFVSDLHLGRGDDRLEWVVEWLEENDACVLVSLGDLGHMADWNLFEKLVLPRVRFYAIYGNHDDLLWLENLRNLDGSRVLLKDGEVFSFSGVRVGFVNGIISPKGGWKDGIPRKTPEEFLYVSKRLKGVDILAMHEFPLPDGFSQEEFGSASLAARKSVLLSKPHLVLCGHVHYRRVLPNTYRIGDTRLLLLDSSFGYYAVLRSSTRRLDVMNEDGVVFSVGI